MERAEAVIKLRELVGKELHELAEKYGVTVYRNEKVNKGWAGHVFERHLQIPINSAQSPNFGSWELKSIKMGEQNDIQKKTICRLIRQLRLMALAHGGKPDAATLYDAADWLQRLGGVTREQTERVNE